MKEAGQFTAAIQASLGNVPLPSDFVPGKLIRFPTSDRRGDEAGWCKLFDDGTGGVFGALDDAKVFLINLLADGPVSSRQIRADAEGAGHAWPTVRRAQKALGIEAHKEAMKGPWLWQLPTKMLNSSEDAQEKTLSTFGGNEHLRQNAEPDNGVIPELSERRPSCGGLVMRVRILEPLTIRGRELPAGQIIVIPDRLFERLQGKVEPIPALLRIVCYWCRGKDFWESARVPGRWVCRICHPPAPEAERRSIGAKNP